MALTKVKAGNILLTTPSASSNDVTPATTQYVTTALANLLDSAPSTLNTLNELAAALGDDANFSTTVTTSIATKLPLAGGTLTGDLILSKSGTDSAGIKFATASANRYIESTHDGIINIGTGATIGGGTKYLTISSAGNVGIGTPSPDSPLEISSTDDTRLKITDTGDSSELMFRSDGVNTQIYTNTAHDLGIYTSSNVGQIHLKQSNGHVGIGTSSPTIGKLQVHGGGASNLATLHLQSDTSTQFNHSINSFNSSLTNGENNLFVLGKEGSTKNSAWIGYKWRSAGSDTNQLTFGHWGNNNVFNILGNGNVGIGIEEPLAPFVIQVPASAVNAEMRFQSGAYTSDHFKAYANQNGRFYIQAVSNTGHGVYLQHNAIAWTGVSDERLKENIVELENVLPKITNLRAVKYNFTADEENTTAIGFIAQDWQTDFSEVVSDSVPEELGIKYTETIPVLLKAIQELKIELDAAKARITTLEQ